MQLAKQLSRYYYYLAWGVLLLIAMAKQEGDPDYNSYLDIYSSSDVSSFLTSGIELLYLFVNRLFLETGLGFQTLIALLGLLLIPPKYFFVVRYTESRWLSLAAYIAIVFIHFDLIAIRQGLAMSILFVGFPLLEKKRTVEYFGVVLLASLFHLSSLVMIPAYFLKELPSLKAVRSAIIIATIAAVLFGTWRLIPLGQILGNAQYLSLFANKIQIYSAEANLNPVSYRELIVALLLFFSYRTACSEAEKNKYLYNLYFIGVAVAILSADIAMLAYRVKFFFIAYEVVIIPTAIRCFSKKVRILWLTPVLSGLIALIYAVSTLTFISAIYERGFSLYFLS